MQNFVDLSIILDKGAQKKALEEKLLEEKVEKLLTFKIFNKSKIGFRNGTIPNISDLIFHLC